MNLIEQLGGYCMSKKVMNGIPKDGRSYTITRDDTGITFNSSELHDALLEYRRAHNIFEEGDKAVSNHENLHLFNDEVLEIDFFRNIGGVEWARFTNGNDYRVDVLRHATSEEIKAGHRL
jgi:hypothetical protein